MYEYPAEGGGYKYIAKGAIDADRNGDVGEGVQSHCCGDRGGTKGREEGKEGQVISLEVCSPLCFERHVLVIVVAFELGDGVLAD